MSNQPIHDDKLLHRLSENLFTCVYNPTKAFQEITSHAAVCDQHGGIVAICGPSDDAQSVQDAQLFAVAGPLFACAIDLMQAVKAGTVTGIASELQGRLLEQIKKAGGMIDNRWRDE